MDDEFDLGNVYQPAVQEIGQQFSGPLASSISQAIEPYTQADMLRQKKLEAGLSTIKQQVDDGTIGAEEAVPLLARANSMLAPLRAREQQAQQKAQAEQTQAIHQQAAQQEAIIQHNSISRKKAFEETVKRYTDPLSGETLHFYQPKPGEWKQMEFPERAGNESAPGDMGASDVGTQAASPEAVTGALPESDSHTLEIWNGPDRTLVHFKKDPFSPTGWKTIGYEGSETGMGDAERARREQGREAADSSIDPQYGIPKSILGLYQRDAEKNTPQIDPSKYPNSDQGRLRYLHDKAARDQAIAYKVSHLATEYNRARQHDRDIAARSEENQRKEAARQEALKSKQAGGASVFKPQEDSKIRLGFRTEVQKEYAEAVKNAQNDPSKIPEELRTREAREAEANSRYEQHMLPYKTIPEHKEALTKFMDQYKDPEGKTDLTAASNEELQSIQKNVMANPMQFGLTTARAKKLDSVIRQVMQSRQKATNQPAAAPIPEKVLEKEKDQGFRLMGPSETREEFRRQREESRRRRGLVP